MIWLLGAKGMLGRIVEEELEEAGLPIRSSGSECDVTDSRSIRRHAPTPRPAWIVNCTGYTAVDRAEKEPGSAWAVNRDGPANIARYASGISSRLIHISTDYVFGGPSESYASRATGDNPRNQAEGYPPEGYSEAAWPAPINVYGSTKEAGERIVRRLLHEHIIIRTAWLYAEHGTNFLLTMLRLMSKNEQVSVVADQIGSPTYARDLARAVLSIVTARALHSGVFHFTNAGRTSWHEFACAIQEQALARDILKSRACITPVTSDAYPTAAVRPRFSVLSCKRIGSCYDVVPRPWIDGLADCLERIPPTFLRPGVQKVPAHRAVQTIRHRSAQQ